ncbi:MAG: hypothetical protein SH821_16435 [Phototrophicales bacterium]|nr:hypothetical protein [Phototrophicales bacterium]
MLDDLRRSGEDDEFSFGEDDEFDYGTDISNGEQKLFLGMTPLERMFISMFLFMNVAVLGIALLLATGRLG